MSDVRPPVAVDACGACDVTHPNGWGWTEEAGRHQQIPPVPSQREARKDALEAAKSWGQSHKKRCDEALELLSRFGATDGGHHKAWVIDQVVRILVGSDAVYARWVDDYQYTPPETMSPEDEEYAKEEAGPDGRVLWYAWDEGIAP